MSIKWFVLTLSLAGLAGCQSLMQPPPTEPDPTEQKLVELERRLAALERVLASGALTELTVQTDELQREVATLRGRADSLEYEAETTASRQRELYVDLDDRVQSIETSVRSQPAAPAAPVAGALPVPAGSDRENYEAAFELLKQQRYEEAGAAFAQFLRSFPNSQLADNAQYWLAEAYYVTDKFEQALSQFQVVLSRYPRSRKMPDALLKIGYSYYELERWGEARTALERVRQEFPDSTAARLAEQRLTRMTEEGQ
jgi:tol-pal system protein YbgF